MNSIILCEGSSDFVLFQYYMRTVYGRLTKEHRISDWIV